MKKFFSLFTALLFVGTMFAAEGDTHDFTQSLSQLLNNNASIASINIAEQEYPIKEVIISFRYNKTITNAVTMEVLVDGTSWGSQYSEGTDSNYKTRSFTHDAATGAVVINFTNNTGSGTGHGTFYVNKVTLVEGAPEGAVAAPTFTPDASTFEGSVNVTLTSATAGASIYYTLDGSVPTSASTLYSAAIPLTATTTIKAIAIKEAVESVVTTKTYTKTSPITCAEVYTFEKDAALGLNDVTVTCVGGRNVFVKDATGYMLLYLPDDATWNPGDVLSGAKGKLDIYQGLYEIKPSAAQVSATTATAGAAPAPEELTAAPAEADISKYIIYKDVTVEAGSFTASNTYNELDMTIGEETVTLRNALARAFTFVPGTHYNVTGAVAKNSNGIVVYFASAEEKVCSAPVTITKGAELNGTFELSATEICGDDGGDAVTITDITPAAGYEFDAITTSASGTVDNVNKKVTGITANTTITVTFKALPKYTVSFSTGAGNDEVAAVTETLGGQGITLPAGVAPECSDWTFAGWAEAAVDAETTTTPALLEVGANYKPTANTTLYAVYSKNEGASAVHGNTTINASIAGVSGSYADGTDKGDYKWSYTQLMLNTGCVQGNSSKSSILWNTVEFPAAISKVVLEVGRTAGSSNTAALCFGSTVKPEESSVALGSGTDYALDLLGALTVTSDIPANSTYMSLLWTSGASYYSAVTVYWGDAGTTTYVSEPTCSGTSLSNTAVENKAVKFIENGQLIINLNGVLYNALGERIR